MRVALLVVLLGRAALAQKLADEPDLAGQLRALAASLEQLSKTVQGDAQVPAADRLQMQRIRDALPALATQAMMPVQRVVDLANEMGKAADKMPGTKLASQATDADLQLVEAVLPVAKRFSLALDTFVTEGAAVEANATGLMNWLTPRAKESEEARRLEKVVDSVAKFRAKAPELKSGVEKSIAAAEKMLTEARDWRASQKPKKK